MKETIRGVTDELAHAAMQMQKFCAAGQECIFVRNDEWYASTGRGFFSVMELHRLWSLQIKSSDCFRKVASNATHICFCATLWAILKSANYKMTIWSPIWLVLIASLLMWSAASLCFRPGFFPATDSGLRPSKNHIKISAGPFPQAPLRLNPYQSANFSIITSLFIFACLFAYLFLLLLSEDGAPLPRYCCALYRNWAEVPETCWDKS